MKCLTEGCDLPMHSLYRSPRSDMVCVAKHRHTWAAISAAVLKAGPPQTPPKLAKPTDATVRTALRNALYRVFGSSIDDVSPLFRQIEAGMSLSDATDALELHLRRLVDKERKDAQAVYKRPAR